MQLATRCGRLSSTACWAALRSDGEKPRCLWRVHVEFDLPDDAAHPDIRGGVINYDAGRVEHPPAEVTKAMHMKLGRQPYETTRGRDEDSPRRFDDSCGRRATEFSGTRGTEAVGGVNELEHATLVKALMAEAGEHDEAISIWQDGHNIVVQQFALDGAVG